MVNIFCCFKGTNQAVQDPPDPPQQQAQQDPLQEQQPQDPPQQQSQQDPLQEQQPQDPPEQPSQQQQTPQDPPEQTDTDSSETVEYDPENPFGSNEYLNNLYRRCSQVSASESRTPSPPLLSYSGVTYRWIDILHGTVNFRREYFLGQGNFGEVYHCYLPGDLVGAVKVQKHENAFAHSEFVTEITTLHAANHPNVIKLLGKAYSRHDDQRVIIYEYMTKGSLDRHLIPRKRPDRRYLQVEAKRLDWDTRMRIAVGVAKALVYLHNDMKMLHRDVKVSNILLDEYFEPKLTDFGLATRIVTDEDGEEVAHVVHPIKGTPGCMPPETEQLGLVSTKTDVYGYGVFLFSLLTGRKAYDDLRTPPEAIKLTDWLIPVWSRDENMLVVADAVLGYRFSVEGLYELFLLARMCTEPHASARPDMVDVEEMVLQAAAHPASECPSFTRRDSI